MEKGCIHYIIYTLGNRVYRAGSQYSVRSLRENPLRGAQENGITISLNRTRWRRTRWVQVDKLGFGFLYGIKELLQ